MWVLRTVSGVEEVRERKRAVVQIRLQHAPGYLEGSNGVCLWRGFFVGHLRIYCESTGGGTHESQNVSQLISLKTDLRERYKWRLACC
jgi:hypothetical protein